LSNRRSKTTSQHYPDCPDPDHGPTASFIGVAQGRRESANGSEARREEGQELGANADQRLGTIHKELEDQVRDLNGKIAELTALIMAQQGAVGMSESPA
jgi:TolA-binding protein